MSSHRLRLALGLALVSILAVVWRQIAVAPHADSGTAGTSPSTVVAAAVTNPANPAICAPASEPTGAKFQSAIAARARREDALAKTAAFTAWFADWRRAEPEAQPALAVAGRALAATRRAALKYLIETDPKRALDLAVPVGLRAELPAEIETQLEQRIDARGDLDVSVACLGEITRTERVVRIDGANYQGYVFGRREMQSTKHGLPLHGIAVDGALALDEKPYRQLDDGEKSTRGLPLDQPAVLVGRETIVLAEAREIDAFAARLVAAESDVGPELVRSSADSGDPVHHDPGVAAVTSPPSWINGEKRVLWLKLEFSDDPGEAYSDAELQAMATTVNEFYLDTSHTKTSTTFTTLPQVLRLTRDKAFFNSSSTTTTDMRDDAKALAKAYDAANGNTGKYDPDRYDRWIMVFKKVQAFAFGGLGNVGGPVVWLNNSIGSTAHELGHTQSLRHAHAWLPSTSSPSGPGSHVEYGDVFDRMGTGTEAFNVAQKGKLGYLEGASITTVTAAGVHRLNRHDHRDSSGVRALKIESPYVEYNYWIEHRRNAGVALNATQLQRLQNGVLIHWDAEKLPNFVSGPGSYLLDMTPGSAGGMKDAALRTGESFTDPDAGVTIKPLAVGGAAPTEYIDVQVQFGAIDGNRNPTLIANAPATSVGARTNIVFNASGSDPDGDPVYFRWDFGDGKPLPKLDSITQRFAKGGSFTVRVSAHDGKGGIAARTYAIEVTDPLLKWTARTSGVTTVLNDVKFAGGRFVAAGTGFVLTSADGAAWTRRDAGNTNYNWLGIAHSGARYVVVGQRNSTSEPGGAAYSDDAVTWTVATVPVGMGLARSVAYGAGRFVAVGDGGRIYGSGDGATWTTVTSPVTSSLRAVAFADGVFVASGESGRIITSRDGLTWANRSVVTSNTLIGLTRHNGVWYASSATLECFSSADGATWTRTATAGRTNNTQRLISAAGVLFTTTANGSIAFTEDPHTWSTHQIESAANTTFLGAAEGNGALVVVGSRGLVFAAALPAQIVPPLLAPELLSPAASIKVSAGKRNVLAASGTGFVKLELYANGTKVSEIDGAAGALSWTPPAIGNYSLTVRGVTATGESAVSEAVPALAGFADWDWRNPSPIGTDLNAAVHVGNRWWIVGRCGTLLTLDAGGNATPIDFPTTQHLSGIAYANGRFVISAPYVDAATNEPAAYLWTSSDGYAWDPIPSDAPSVSSSPNLNFIVYADNKWLGGAVSGLILTSSDGLEWTRQGTGITNSLRGAAFGNGRWVAVGAAGRIITSSDAVAWAARTSGATSDLWSVAFNNGAFVAVGLSGTILRSTDGITWTRPTSPVTSSLFNVTAWKGSFIAVGNLGVVLVSNDGITWSRAATNGTTSDGFFVAGSDDEGLLVGRAGAIYTGNTPNAWQRLTQGTGEAKQAVIYAGGKFVAVGANSDPITGATIPPVLYSTDGASWTRAAANSAFTNLNAITYGQQRYVAVGPNSGVFTSTDAVTWTARTLPATSTPTGVAAGPNSFVLVSSGGAIYSSPDGSTWTQRANNLGVALRSAAYGGGRFVVAGDTGFIRYSADGVTWTAATSGTNSNLLKVAWFDEIGFIAVGNGGTMLSSVDGAAWRQLETGFSDNLTAIAQTPAGLVAAGGTNGTIIVSPDGESWLAAVLPMDRVVRGFAANSSTIVGVGDNGALLTYALTNTTPAPAIIAQPLSVSAAAGNTVTFTVGAQNAAGAVYQWLKDGTPIAGANSPIYTIPTVAAAHVGNYSATITTATGKTTSATATLSFGAVADPGRLINLSILTSLTGGADNFTFGVVVGGANTSGGKALLVRAAGPSLTALGVGGVLDDPKLEFFTGSAKVGENDNWGGVAATAAVMAQVGAFPFTGPTSRDAAISLPSLASGANSAKISGTGAGTVIAELYDATPSSAFTSSTPRLINVSVLKHIGTGVTAGFILGGSTSRTVLIRAIGPTLAGFGVGGVVADPQLALFSGQTQLRANDNWGGASSLSAAFTQVGAFALASDSKDAALLATLEPGSYTVQVSGVGGITGVALVEVYEVPE